jgi:putative hydrolase of the HAD superfamily
LISGREPGDVRADMNDVNRPRAPRAVIFDLGKVLLDFDYTRAARALSSHSALAPTEFKRVVDQSPLLHQFESGGLTNQEFYQEVSRLTQYRGSFDEFAAAFGDIFDEIEPMIALQRQLRERGIPTWIFSNTNDLAVGHIRRRYPFFAGFQGYVLSHEIGAMKPLPASYESVEARTGHRGADLLYLDDRLENIEGARQRGWRTIHHAVPAESIQQVLTALEWVS